MAHETVIRSSLILNDVQNSTAPATNFLVLSGTTDLVTTRTAAQMLNDIFPLSGSANQVAYWNSSSGITGNNNFWWNNSNNRLGIGTSSPNQTLEVAGTMRLTGSTGTGTTLMGRNADGDISAISVNSGLSLSGNTLTSTNGLPASGLTGQILAKNSAVNYDVSWIDNISAIERIQLSVKNNQGATVSKGQVVYIDGAVGTNVTIKLAKADAEATSSKTLGLLKQDLLFNEIGYVITEGLLSGINTSAATNEGDPVWLDPNNAGGLIFGLANKPVAPAHLVYLGVVVRKNNINGEIYVKVQNGYELQELHNVLIPSSVTNNDLLAYETSTSLWKNKSFSSLGLVSGTGTTNYIPKWNSSTSLADSVIFQSGTSVGIGTTTLSSDRLDIKGTPASESGQIGAELMTTGAGTNWSGTSFISGYTHTIGDTAALTSTISVSSNSYYQIIYTINGRTTGTVTVSVGGISSGAVSVSGLLQSVTNTTAVTITPTTDFNGTIILSVKLITASIATFVMKNNDDDVVYEQRANKNWSNIFQGVESGQYNTSGANNVFLGRRAGTYNTTGLNNVFQGSFAGESNTIGSYNVYQGVGAGEYNTTGSYNVFIGYLSGALYGSSGSVMKIANNSILFGYRVRTLADGETNATVIGYQAIGLGSNTTVIGNSDTIQTWLGGKLSVGTTSNTAYLNVQGSGSTSATTTVNVQNSSATALLTIKDDGTTQVTGTLRLTGSIGTGATLMARDANGDVSAISVGSGLSLSANTLTSTGGGGGISGTGTTNYIPKWNSSTSLADSVIFQSGTSVGIGTNSPTSRLQIIGTGTGTTVPLLIQNSVLTSKLTVKDNGAIEIGSNAAVTGTTTATIQVVDSSNTNVGLALSPKGSGAFTLSIPDGTSTGGNSRGIYAVDFQRIRNFATQIASGDHSYIGGGERNVASGTYAIIVTGADNLASSQYSIVMGGNTNVASALHSIVTGGNSNRAATTYSIINGGRFNTTNSVYSTINGGIGAVTTLYGQIARSSGAFGSGIFNDPADTAFADAQKSELILRRSITGTGSTELFLDGVSLQAILPSANTQGILWNAKIQLAAVIETSGTSSSVAVGDSFISEHTVGIKRIGNTCVLVGGGAVQNLMSKDTSMDTATVTIAANDTTDALTIFFKPPTTAVATTVTRVVATIYLTEVGF